MMACLPCEWMQNKEGRTIYLDDELMGIFKDQRLIGKVISPYVFPNRNSDGQIKVFRRAWTSACREIGMPGRIFHDLGRTAVRNMVRYRVPERVAMMISGHKTRAVFERYNIVSESDLMAAAKRQEEYLKSQPGTVIEIPIKKASSENR